MNQESIFESNPDRKEIEKSLEPEIDAMIKIVEFLHIYHRPIGRNFLDDHIKDAGLDADIANQALEKLIESGFILTDEHGRIYLKSREM